MQRRSQSGPGRHRENRRPRTSRPRGRVHRGLNLCDGQAPADKCPRSSHAVWKAPHDRPDPLRLLKESNKGRLPELIPIRYGRMVRTPFTFYRGAALNMAADLAVTPATGLRVQACGDCHLLNFGDFATPERRVIFDINDLDETLPAPWEWDVKRLVASFVLACRNNGFSKASAHDAALACVRSYRERMVEYSQMPVLDVWYAHIDVEKVLPTIKDKEARRRHQKMVAKARARSVAGARVPEARGQDGWVPTIKDSPPSSTTPVSEGVESCSRAPGRVWSGTGRACRKTAACSSTAIELKDIAIKVVGVGSVGTFCAVMLLMASEQDPLFLQVKEARSSVLEAYAGKSIYPIMASGS